MYNKKKPRAKNNRLDPDFVSGLDLEGSINKTSLERDFEEQESRDNFF